MTLVNIRSTRPLPIVLAGGLVAITLSSCGPSKVSQCNKFVEVVNKEESIADTFLAKQQELEQSFASQDQAAISNAATAIQDYSKELDAIVEEVEALELEDETVAGFQTRYVQSQVGFKEGILEVAQLMEKIGTGAVPPDQFQAVGEQMTAAQTKISEAEQQAATIRTDYAAYCTGDS